MISIIVKKEEIFLKINNQFFYYNILELEKEFEDIKFECGLKNNEKVILILDFEAEDLQYYLDIFSSYKLKIKKVINFVDVIKATKLEYIYLGKKSSLSIEGEKIEVLNVTLNDKLDYSGIKTILITKDNIEEIFKLIENTKVKNVIYNNIYHKNWVYIIISIVIFVISFLVSNNVFKTSHLQKQIQKNVKITHELESKISSLTLSNKMLNQKILDNKNLKDINNFIEKKEYYSVIQKLISYSKKDIYFKNIIFEKKKIILEGIASNYQDIISCFPDYKIEYLLSVEDKIGFKVLKEFSDE